MSQICSCCGDKLKNSKHYEVICRDATEHEERIKKVDELQENKSEEDKEKKVNDLATLKAKLHDLEERMKDVDDDELNDLLESLRGQMDELEKLKPDEEKQSRESLLEYLATESPRHNKIPGDHLLTGASVTHQSNYSVLMLDQSYRDRKPGDKLLIRLGSVD